MKNLLLNIVLITSAFMLVFISACKKEEPEVVANPYDDPSILPPTIDDNLTDIDPSNFAYIQNNILKPTCANSGCHDGTFPPDYRTINSSYNTLVYQTPVNNSNGAFDYRVLPFNADKSILFHRMTVSMASGIMPIDYSVGSDWEEKADEYILNIKNWINAGAQDMFGNFPVKGNQQPTISGILAFPSGNTSSAYARGAGNIAPINIPANSSIDLWFTISDDSTSVQSISGDDCKISKSMYNYTPVASSTINYIASGVTANDFEGNSAQYSHKTTINTASYASGEYLYLRIYLNDGSQAEVTEIPNDGTGKLLSGLFTLKIQ